MTASPPVITDASVTLSFGPAGQYYGYCTIADLLFEVPQPMQSAYTQLTHSIIGQTITYAAMEIQEMLNPYYVMPYTGSDWNILARLREMNAKLAWAVLMDRTFTGAEPDASAWGEKYRAWVELVLSDIKDGVIRWDAPNFGDATPQAMLPVYDLAQGASIGTSTADQVEADGAGPIFTVDRNRFRDNAD